MEFTALLHAFFAFVVGIMVGLTGVGGGSLMTPGLIFLFNVPAISAIATDLIAIAVIKSFGAFTYYKKHLFVSDIIVNLWVGSIPAALITIYIMNQLPEKNTTLVYWSLIIVVALTLLITVIRPVIQQWKISNKKNTPTNIKFPIKKQLFLVLIGVILGIFVSISSVGGGVLGLAVISVMFPNLPTRVVVGSDIIHTLLLSIIAGAGHQILGNHLNYPLLFSLIAGGVPGVIAGSLLMYKIPEKIAKYLVMIILFIILVALFLNQSNFLNL